MVSPDRLDSPLPYLGLTSEQVKLHRKQFGVNVLTPPQRDPWWKLYLEKFADPVIRILIIAAIIALIAGIIQGEYAEALGILSAIFLSTSLAFLNEYQANQEFELLNKVYDINPVKVIRNGAFAQISCQDLVVGDIAYIEHGNEVPADGEVLDEVSLYLDQSKITGESVPTKKITKTAQKSTLADNSTYSNFKLYRSTIVTQGYGFFEVTAVGDNTEIGKLAQAVVAIEIGELTPLTIQLEKLSKLIGIVGLLVSSLIFFALLIRGILIEELNLTSSQLYLVALMISSIIIVLSPVWLPIINDGLNSAGLIIDIPELFKKSNLEQWILSSLLAVGLLLLGIIPSYFQIWGLDITSIILPQDIGITILNYFMVAVTIIVVAVPEGLAMSVTLSLAYSVRKMSASNNLVRRMNACETLGAVTVICADKTGTVTQNKMQVKKADFAFLDDSNSQQLEHNKQLLYEGISANSTADLEKQNSQSSRPIGNVTEGALLLWLEEQNINYLQYRNNFETFGEITFSAENKYMATAGKSSVIDRNILYLKGAPEIILSRCSHQLTKKGIEPLEDYNLILNSIEQYQNRGMRTLGFAYNSLDSKLITLEVKKLDHNLVWLGFVGIIDPLRPDVKLALQNCLKAGIEVKIVTGDSNKTAQEIARMINLYSTEDELNNRVVNLTGQEFAQLSDQEAKEAIKSLKVLSRATPLDKLRLVRLLQQNGEVVAVTGDGTNDAAALKQAQVGLAMGSGTAIAKEASEMILLDDSFTSIVTGVMWGRSLYENIQRFILFQLTINLVALGIALLGPFIGISLPLTVTQMLWINLIMDSFAALALATEPPHWQVMERQPRNPQNFIISNTMLESILTTGLGFLSFMVGFLVYLQRDNQVTDYELSVFFAVFVLLQFWNLFNARSFGLQQSAILGLEKNLAFVGIATAIFFGQIIIIQWGNKIFRTVPLSWQDWIIIILGTSIVLWLGEIRRFIKRVNNRTINN